jgi:twinkle protein
MTALSEAAMKWFLSRGIEPETVVNCGIYSMQQDQGGDTIVFPFLENGEAVNEKFRGRGKKFWQREGGKKTFWNADVIRDDALRDQGRLIITEGEMDALTAIDSGFPLAVSVPDGAPAKVSADDPDPDDDAKFDYIWNCWPSLKTVKRIILATDNDAPGKALAAELVRRLGIDRCMFVAYPDDCKDLNEVVLKYGQAEVARVLNAARPYPVQGLYSLSDYPSLAEPESFSTGWDSVDRNMKIQAGGFVVVTGIPNHGKSTWTNALLCNLIRQHGWHVCVASFEMPVVPYLRDNIRQIYIGKPRLSGMECGVADEWIEQNFKFISQNQDDDEQDFDIEQIIELATISVVRHGTRVLVIDPWNEIEHQRRRDETETDYIGRAIRQLKKFARRHEVCVIVVAHPVKMGGSGHGVSKPGAYDISGSSHWANKPDSVIVVWRNDIQDCAVEIDVKKQRFRSAGKPGISNLLYDEDSGRFSESYAAVEPDLSVMQDRREGR